MAFSFPKFNLTEKVAEARAFVRKMAGEATATAQAVAGQIQHAAQAVGQFVHGVVAPAANQAVAKVAKGKQAIAKRTVAQVKSAVAGAKKFASATKKVADDKVVCPLQQKIAEGRANAKAADAKENTKAPDLLVKTSKGYATEVPGGRLEKTPLEVEGQLFSQQQTWLQYGPEDNSLVIGQARGSVVAGYSYDSAKGERFAGAKAKGELLLAEYKAKGETAHGLLSGEFTGVAGKIGGEAKLGAEWDDKGGARLAGAIGVEAVAASVKGQGQLSVTPKTIYDNACNLVVPGSTYCDAPKWLDHGIVGGTEAEIGYGAAAKAEGAIGKLDNGTWGVKGSAKLGAGLFGGIMGYIGIK